MSHQFQIYLNPQVGINKLVNSVSYHPCPSRLASGIHPFIYFFKLRSILSLQNACWILSDFYIPTRGGGGRFSIYGVHIHRKCVESISFTHVPVPHLKLQVEFFENLFPPRQKEWRKLWNFSIKTQSEIMKMIWNISFFKFCMICNFPKCDGFTVL